MVIETNASDELAIVSLSGHDGKNKTRLKGYQGGNSYFKHFVEINDNENKPIKVGKKFRENHKNQDVSKSDIDKIRDRVFKHSAPSPKNLEKIKSFRSRGKRK